MTLRAMGFHEAVSVEKLEELFAADENVLFAGTIARKCPTCGLRFAVFFPAKDDPRNAEYLKSLEERMWEDCNGGKHRGEYVFTTTP
jgi:hypothetical protein